MTHPLCMSMEMAILTSTIRHDVCDDLFVTAWSYPCFPPAKHSGLKSAKGNGKNYSIPTLLKHVETTATKNPSLPISIGSCIWSCSESCFFPAKYDTTGSLSQQPTLGCC